MYEYYLIYINLFFFLKVYIIKLVLVRILSIIDVIKEKINGIWKFILCIGIMILIIVVCVLFNEYYLLILF